MFVIVFMLSQRVCNVKAVRDVWSKVSVPDVTAEDMFFNASLAFCQDCGESNSTNNNNTQEAEMNAEDAGEPISEFPRFSMCLGDFESIYSASDNIAAWDAITTCFFIDTAHVVLRYLQVIYDLLKPGGYWINQGPLLYHWLEDVDNNGDSRYAQSIEVK